MIFHMNYLPADDSQISVANLVAKIAMNLKISSAANIRLHLK